MKRTHGIDSSKVKSIGFLEFEAEPEDPGAGDPLDEPFLRFCSVFPSSTEDRLFLSPLSTPGEAPRPEAGRADREFTGEPLAIPLKASA